jgi:hypothetical protein
MIYFMQPTDGGPVKIGYTENLEQRRLNLESAYRRPLAVLATMEGGREEEAAIHQRFDHLRIGRSEQFRPAADLMCFIVRPLLVGPNPDAIEPMEDHRKPLIIQVRGSRAYKEWYEELARFDGLSPTALFDRAIRRYAKEIGFLKEAPQR